VNGGELPWFARINTIVRNIHQEQLHLSQLRQFACAAQHCACCALHGSDRDIPWHSFAGARNGMLTGVRPSDQRESMKHINWEKLPAEKLNDKFVRKLAWDGKVMIGQTLVEKGYVVPLHSHDNQQVTFVTSGLWRFQLEGRTVDVGPNEMIFIPANVPHTAEAVETLVAYDVFTPPRKDWIEGNDAYLRAK
jgi:quercetin dioxygenase-like cupin family protein